MPVDVVRDLIEIDVGEKQGALFDEKEDCRSGPMTVSSWKGGESLEQVLERGLLAIRRLHRELPGGTVLVIAHGGVTRILVSHYLGILPKLDASRQTNTAVTVIVSDGERGRIDRLFESAHVADRPPER